MGCRRLAVYGFQSCRCRRPWPPPIGPSHDDDPTRALPCPERRESALAGEDCLQQERAGALPRRRDGRRKVDVLFIGEAESTWAHFVRD